MDEVASISSASGFSSEPSQSFPPKAYHQFIKISEDPGSVARFPLDHIIALDPQAALIWLFKGAVLFNLKRYRKALHAIDHALTIDPQIAQAWFLRAKALHALGNSEEAIV